MDEVMELRALNYNWTKIAAIMNISRATLYRKLNEAGISTNDYSQVTNQQLDELVASIKQDHPYDGEILLNGHLRSKGIRVTRQALRDSIHRVDHSNVLSRRHDVIRRRIYSVSHPNSVWHIDGHHKLIRWRFVIHGAIDGFSRTITYLGCADNNQAATVFELYTSAISQFGLPDQVRSDCGGENTKVWKYMIWSHNMDYSSVITGSSVHNERIERLWRDVHRCVVGPFAQKFRILEERGYLDPLNEVDLYVLHWIFMPHIKKCISEFKNSWNHHALSSEGNMTPLQLFFEGLLASSSSAIIGIDGTIDVDVSDFVGEQVDVPRSSFNPCPLLQQHLDAIDTLNSDDSGVALFINTIQMVGLHLSSPCNQCN